MYYRLLAVWLLSQIVPQQMESKRKQKQFGNQRGTDKETLIDAENIIGEKYPMLLGTAATVAGITQFYTPVLLSDYLSVSCSLFRRVVSYTSVYIVI